MDVRMGLRLRDHFVRNRLTLAVAESLSSGRLQAAIGAISGASNFFEGGLTAYSLEQKVRLLNVNREHAASVNSVSSQVAVELARGACAVFRADIGVGTTGYAEPDPDFGIGTPMAYYAICRTKCGEASVLVTTQIFGDGLGRTQMQEHVAQSALNALARYLEIDIRRE